MCILGKLLRGFLLLYWGHGICCFMPPIVLSGRSHYVPHTHARHEHLLMPSLYQCGILGFPYRSIYISVCKDTKKFRHLQMLNQLFFQKRLKVKSMRFHFCLTIASMRRIFMCGISSVPTRLKVSTHHYISRAHAIFIFKFHTFNF